VVLAEDDNSYEPTRKLPELDDGEEMVLPKPGKALLEKLLFCGWRRDLHALISCLDDFVHPGTQLWLYNNVRPPCQASLLRGEGTSQNAAQARVFMKGLSTPGLRIEV
jgi:hypothetical protein